MFSNQRKSKKSIHFEIIPMIDVMMILVLFLAVMAFLPSVQSAIPTSLPKSGSEDKISVEDLLITMSADGAYYVDDEPVTLNSLVSTVNEQMEADPERRVVIAADKNLAYEYVVQILSDLKDAGIRNVALATEGK